MGGLKVIGVSLEFPSFGQNTAPRHMIWCHWRLGKPPKFHKKMVMSYDGVSYKRGLLSHLGVTSKLILAHWFFCMSKSADVHCTPILTQFDLTRQFNQLQDAKRYKCSGVDCFAFKLPWFRAMLIVTIALKSCSSMYVVSLVPTKHRFTIMNRAIGALLVDIAHLSKNTQHSRSTGRTWAP